MSEELSALDVLTESLDSLELLTRSAPSRYIPGATKAAAAEMLSTLGQFGWQLVPIEAPQTAIAKAEELLTRSSSVLGNVGGQASTAVALQGILTLQIERHRMMMRQWGIPEGEDWTCD